METIWVLIVTISGVVANENLGSPPGLISGHVENKSTFYFETEADCTLAREALAAQVPGRVQSMGFVSGNLTLEQCAAMEVVVETQE